MRYVPGAVSRFTTPTHSLGPLHWQSGRYWRAVLGWALRHLQRGRQHAGPHEAGLGLEGQRRAALRPIPSNARSGAPDPWLGWSDATWGTRLGLGAKWAKSPR